jgi:transposase
MNSKELFQLALGLQAPWDVHDIRFEQTESGQKSLHITIGFARGCQFHDETGVPCPVHDTLEREWRHLNFFQHKCYLYCNVPRIRCTSGKVRQVAVPWAREGSGFTLLFEAFAMGLVEAEMPVNKVGETLGEYPNRIWTIFDHWLGIAYSEADHSTVRQLGLDETSSKKGHNYVTVGVDMEQRRVVHATEGKDAAAVKSIREHLETKGCPPEQVEQVCIDLSPAFFAGVTAEFEKAAVTFDRFHVKQLLNKAMDEVRKKERGQHELLKGHKYTFLKSNAKLSARAKRERGQLLELYPTLGEAYRLKELFDDFWGMKDAEEAKGFLAFWCDLAEESKIFPFQRFAATVKSHWSGIVNYLDSNLSNGILEGINSQIQLAKKRARGYRNMKNFINMIYLVAGKLNFSYPHQST